MSRSLHHLASVVGVMRSPLHSPRQHMNNLKGPAS